MHSAVSKLLSVEKLVLEVLLRWRVLPWNGLGGVSDYEGLSLAFECKAVCPPHPPRHPPRPKAPLVQILHWEPEGRRRIQNRGSVYLTKCSRMSFSFQYKTSHNRFRLSGEMTDDWNEWLCVWEVNLMDGCSVSLSFPRKIHHSGRNLFHTSTPRA